MDLLDKHIRNQLEMRKSMRLKKSRDRTFFGLFMVAWFTMFALIISFWIAVAYLVISVIIDPSLIGWFFGQIAQGFNSVGSK